MTITLVISSSRYPAFRPYLLSHVLVHFFQRPPAAMAVPTSHAEAHRGTVLSPGARHQGGLSRRCFTSCTSGVQGRTIPSSASTSRTPRSDRHGLPRPKSPLAAPVSHTLDRGRERKLSGSSRVLHGSHLFFN